MELQITEDIARNLDCDVVLEAANGPLYLEADKILENRNIDVLPDILSNSGGVIVSNYEYIQNKNIESEDNYASKDEILNRLSKQMKETFNIVYDHVQNKNITYKDACYGTALINLEKNLSQNIIYKVENIIFY